MKDYGILAARIALAESEVESYFYRKAKVDGAKYHYFPRLYKHSRFLDKSYTKVFFVFLFFVWPLVFLVVNLFFLAHFIKMKLFLSVRCVNYEYFKSGFSGVFFASSDLAVELYDKVDKRDCAILHRPGGKKDSSDLKNKNLDSLELLTISELVKIYFQVSSISLMFFSDSRKRNIQFFLLYLYEVLIVAEALRKLSKKSGLDELSITDHYDRWMVLSDFLRNERLFSSLTIIQHGVLALNDANDFDVLIPNKFENVDCLYYFDDVSKVVFEDFIFNSPENVRFKKYSNHINLRPIGSIGNASISILIVGSPLCFNFHEKISFAISERYRSVYILYKPHPTQPTFGKNKACVWHWIDDSNFFPKVDFVISYPSSLAVQYQSLSVPVIYHNIDADFSEIGDCFSKLDHLIESKK